MDIIKPGYTRISDILQNLRDRSDIHPQVLKTKGEIGTEVHRNIHLEKTDGFAIFGDYPILHPITGETLRWDKRGIGYFKSFSEWDKTFDPKYLVLEKRYYEQEFMLTGQVDALVTFPDKSGLRLIDFKTSHTADVELWNMQAHFYYYLLCQNHIEVVPTFTWIQLKKDGKKPKTFEFLFDENVLARCLEETEKYFELKSQAKSLD